MRAASACIPALVCASACAAGLHPIPRPIAAASPLRLVREAQAYRPFTVCGERGGIYGQQNGIFEAWIFPVKILSRFRIHAEIDRYPVPIELNDYAAGIEVTPAVTTITYSHPAFTVRQHMFAPSDAAGVAVLFDVDAIRPLHLTFEFEPDVERMWPAPNFGRPSAEWIESGGYYILHTDSPHLAAAIGLPRSTPGILVPYQERPRTYPLEFRLAIDPAKDAKLSFPLLMAVGQEGQELRQRLEAANDKVAELYARSEAHYTRFFDSRLWAETPDGAFNDAMRWAVVAIEQSRVRFHGETGLAAGFGQSVDSARPGFGWFFGRDTLWTLFAIHSYGDFALSRQALEFLIRRQRADGKIMHEYSQTADLVDWAQRPYFYAAADSTPLLVMAMNDYVAASGDTGSPAALGSRPKSLGIHAGSRFRRRRDLRKHRRNRMGGGMASEDAASGDLLGGSGPAIV